MKVRSLALGFIVAVFVPAAQAADKPAERAARVALPRRQLLPQPGPFWGTKLSRDGRRIAFVRGGREEPPRIFVVPFAGGSAQPVTPPGVRPSWSPDGEDLAYASNASGAPEIWLMDASGENPRQLTHGGDAEDPVWSPDGKWIAYGRQAGKDWHLWVISAAGGEPRQLTNRPGAAWGANWSPDSRNVVFMANWPDGQGSKKIWVAPLVGGEPRQLTSGSAPDDQPAWSPDGCWIAFTSKRSGNWDLWVMPAQGGEPIQLTDDELMDDFPDWSPDGMQLVFDAGTRTLRNIYAMDVAGALPARKGCAAASGAPGRAGQSR